MKIPKQYHQLVYSASNQHFIIEGTVSGERLKDYTFHNDLKAFRESDKQQRSIITAANLPEGRIIIARIEKWIVGYIAFTYPDQKEHWSIIGNESFIELGAIEVAIPYRKLGLAKQMLEVAMMDGTFENYITITTLYYWHWDLKNTKLTVWQYREMMKKVLVGHGFAEYKTKDPDIQSDPANLLMARIGKNVSTSSLATFDFLRLYHI